MIAYKMALEGSWIPVWTQVNPVANNLLKGRVPISEKSGMNCVNIAIMGEEVQCQWIQQCCRDAVRAAATCHNVANVRDVARVA